MVEGLKRESKARAEAEMGRVHRGVLRLCLMPEDLPRLLTPPNPFLA